MVRVVRRWIIPTALSAALATCQSAAEEPVWRPAAPRTIPAAQLAAPTSQPQPLIQTQASVEAPPALSLDDLTRLALERNPRLARAGFGVEAARGRAVQAGLYPNPIFQISGDEIGDRTGVGGIWTAPFFTQEIVTGGKLRLSRAAADREVDQTSLTLLNERTLLLSAVRRDYFDALALQRRLAILTELVRLADQAVENTRKLLAIKEASRLDLLGTEVEMERLRAEREAAERELPAAMRRLAASVGLPRLPVETLTGALETPLPDYDLERAREYVLGIHPELRSARVGVERARLLVARAQAEPKPNVTVGLGYTRQNQNKSSDWGLQVNVPLPLWNRNQGNVAAAQAEYAAALQEVARVENDLTDRLATSYRNYIAARQRAERYRTAVIPKAREVYQLSVGAYKGGQFEYLRVLQAQRGIVEADLEYNKALSEAWKSAAEIAGLALEEAWPPRPSKSE